jgi:hypothetical protein
MAEPYMAGSMIPDSNNPLTLGTGTLIVAHVLHK